MDAASTPSGIAPAPPLWRSFSGLFPETAEAAPWSGPRWWWGGPLDVEGLALGSMQAVATAAPEANNVIAQRAFSWTALLTDLEATLPDNVRVTSVQPRVENGVVRVALNVEAANAEALALFMDALEERGTFSEVLPRGQVISEEGVEAGVEATYTAPPANAPAAKTASTRTRRETGGPS